MGSRKRAALSPLLARVGRGGREPQLPTASAKFAARASGASKIRREPLDLPIAVAHRFGTLPAVEFARPHVGRGALCVARSAASASARLAASRERGPGAILRKAASGGEGTSAHSPEHTRAADFARQSAHAEARVLQRLVHRVIHASKSACTQIPHYSKGHSIPCRRIAESLACRLDDPGRIDRRAHNVHAARERRPAICALAGGAGDHRRADARPPAGRAFRRRWRAASLGLDARDRALARSIATVAMRRLGTIRKALDRLPREGHAAKGGLAGRRADRRRRAIAVLEASDHAAVDLAVRAARNDPASRPIAGLANAVLRNIARAKAEILGGLRPVRRRHARMARAALAQPITARRPPGRSRARIARSRRSISP